jgi:hypothetical protein
VEHKARSFLAALYSNADIDLLSLPAGETSEPKRCTYSLATAEKGLWRRFGAGILLLLFLNRISWEMGLWIVAIFPATCLTKWILASDDTIRGKEPLVQMFGELLLTTQTFGTFQLRVDYLI